MRRFIPYLGDTRAIDAWDELFSRDMLGAVLVGAAIGKVVEKALNLIADGTAALLIAWSVAAVAFVIAFVYWHKLEQAAEDAKDAAS